MDDLEQRIRLLSDQLTQLIAEHNAHRESIIKVQREIAELQKMVRSRKVIEPIKDINQEEKPLPEMVYTRQSAEKRMAEPETTVPENSEWEKFIGENLINKIGIAVTLIGIATGAKYAIDRQLISPAMRIILGYVSGGVLLYFALRLRLKYQNYSAVLMGGALSVFYFITYFAFDYYALITMPLAYGIMLLVTAATVYIAMQFNRQIIALVGMVGAYCIPFLLSDGSGNIAILFTYITIINAGILVIAIKKYWKILSYTSAFFTWLIYLGWSLSSDIIREDFNTALTFLCVFFVFIYAMVLLYKWKNNQLFNRLDIFLLLANALIFYGLGYSLMSVSPWHNAEGVFTLINALIHALVCFAFYKRISADRNVFYLTAGLSVLFITIFTPVQYDTQVTGLAWGVEAAVLVAVSRWRGVHFYEHFAWPVLVFSLFAMINFWEDGAVSHNGYIFFNKYFMTDLLYAVAIFSILWNILKKPIPASHFYSFWSIATPLAISLAAAWCLAGVEIISFYHRALSEIYSNNTIGAHQLIQISDADSFLQVALVSYSMIFALLVAIIARQYENISIQSVSLVLNGVALLTFLFIAIPQLGELRNNFLLPAQPDDYDTPLYAIFIRYIPIILSLLLLLISNNMIKNNLKEYVYLRLELPAIFFVLFLLSNELYTWLILSKQPQPDKLWLSILWGLYALGLIIFGINKRRKGPRIAGIFLLAGTLLKIAFYDLSDLNTIGRTIVFVVLGIILLIASFLYNKFRHHIFGEDSTVSENQT